MPAHIQVLYISHYEHITNLCFGLEKSMSAPDSSSEVPIQKFPLDITRQLFPWNLYEKDSLEICFMKEDRHKPP